MKITADFDLTDGLPAFVRSLASPAIRTAAARGLNEHAEEQRRQAVTNISAYTGVPKGRMAGATKVIKASASASMEAIVRTKDSAIPLHEYGNPVWVRDLNPMADGVWGGPVSSMKGAEATGWNVRRQFAHAFIANGKVVVRKGKDRSDLKVLSMAVLPNELAKPSRPNVRAATFLAVDLEKRVLRHVIMAIGG